MDQSEFETNQEIELRGVEQVRKDIHKDSAENETTLKQ